MFYLRLPRLLALLLAISALPLVLGQTFTSSITGTITDPTGAAIPNATVEIRNMATNDTRVATTQIEGTYRFDQLIPGTYEIAVKAQGFKTHVQQNLGLQAQVASRIDVTMQVGATSDEIQVTATTNLLDTETANTSNTMSSQMLQQLPNPSRNVLNFVFSLAGTTPPPAGQSGRFGVLDQMTSNFGMNGGRTGEASILIDGAPSQAIDWGGMLAAPLQDSVQEQQVIVNTYDSQYSRAGSGIVTLITRGGTSQFHGEGFEYVQDATFNANRWEYNKNGWGISDYRQQQFGGNIGGPIKKSWNLFFFGGYEGVRNPNTQDSGLLNVPTAAERQGDFSQSRMVDPNNPGSTIPVTIYNPFSTTAVKDASGNVIGYTRTQFANNKIPSSLLNKSGAAIANLYPLPNRTPQYAGTDLENFYATGTGQTLSDKMDLRTDWAQNTAHRMFFRFTDRFRQGGINPCFYCNGADTNPNYASSGWLAALNDTITPSPTWVINSLVSYGYWLETQRIPGYGQINASAIGLDPSLFQAAALPYLNASNYAGLSANQDTADVHYARTSSTAQVNITKELSRHSLKFGGNFDVQLISNYKGFSGEFDFNSAMTSCDPQESGPCLANNQGSNLTGNSIASQLLGTTSGGNQGAGISPAMGVHIFGGYIQDQWRVTKKLTVNLGLRYENQRPATERWDRMMYFDPNAANPLAQQVAPGLGGRTIKGAFTYSSSSNRYLWQPNNKDFAPRIGIAYKATDRLVVRTGAGIFYLPPSAMISFDNPGQFYGFATSTPMIGTTNNGYVPANLVSNPFPNGVNQPEGASLGANARLGDDGQQIWIRQPQPTPYSLQWSFSLQYSLGTHDVVEAGYSGVRGKKLLYGNPNINFNQLPGQYLSLGSKLDEEVSNPFYGIAPAGSWLGSQETVPYNQLLRPYPQYTYLGATRSLSGARSAFDALNLKYTHSFSYGLNLLATYQWSKALDNGPEDMFGWATDNQWRDSYNTMLDYNVSTHDIPHAFVTALVYDLPYGKGKQFGSSAPAAARALLGDWQLSSSIRIASGTPIGFPVLWGYPNPLGNYGYPGGGQLADLIRTPHTTGNPDAWIDPSAWAAPSNKYGLGNTPMRMTELRQRSDKNVDLSVAKAFPIKEMFKVQFRAEAFNLFNRPQYIISNWSGWRLCMSCGAFGQMDSTLNQPRLLQFSVKAMF